MVEITDLDLDLWNYKKKKEGWTFEQIGEHCGIKSKGTLRNVFGGTTKRMHEEKYNKLTKWVDE